MVRTSAALVGALMVCATPALAQDFGQDFGLSEIRVGPMFHGLEATSESLLNPFETGQLEDVSFEILWRTPDIDALYWLGSPRPAVGGTLNLKGREQMVHAGLNWHLPIFDTPFWVEGGLGLAAISGYTHDAPPGYRNLGCHVTGYFQGSIGADIGDDWTAMLTVEHSSHAWLCNPENSGLNSLGVRIGYKF
ncbi:acyloxyacyl hydrolase [Devosia enhydra]|nr:acyloxyacyl hydrolase [Devosia enhydra]